MNCICLLRYQDKPTALDTFKVTEKRYLGSLVGVTPKFFFEPAKPTAKPDCDVSGIDSLLKVTILYSHQDQNSDLIEAAVKAGAKGIVIAGLGNGNIPRKWKPTVIALMNKGTPVIRGTRAGTGFVSPKEEGIGAGPYNPREARIPLSLALTQGASMEQIRSYFEQKKANNWPTPCYWPPAHASRVC